MSASPDAAEAILASLTLARTGWQHSLAGERIDCSDTRLHAFLVNQLQNSREERLHAIFLDNGRRFIRDERIGQGSRNCLRLRMRSLLHRALELGAGGLIIAHNHPSGDVRPSEEDIRVTDRLRLVAETLEIAVFDHFIVGGGRVFSMQSGRLL